MVETNENEICSPVYNLFKPYLLGVVVPSVVLTFLLGLGFYPTLFTIPILVLSTIFLVTFTSKRKAVSSVENPASMKLLQDEAEEKALQPAVTETVSGYDAAKEADIGMVQGFQVESPDLPPSDSESSSDDSGSSENPELSWMIPGNLELNPEISDDSVSEDDEDGLIEIAIPGTDHSPGLSEEPKLNHLQSNTPTFLPESIFKQQDLVELLGERNEVNEEENLIEIDISMGSIKCPRFEIEA